MAKTSLPEFSWANPNELRRGIRLSLYYQLALFRHNDLAEKIISLHDNKGELLITLNKDCREIHKKHSYRKELEIDLLTSLWTDAFGESFCKILYDDRFNY